MKGEKRIMVWTPNKILEINQAVELFVICALIVSIIWVLRCQYKQQKKKTMTMKKKIFFISPVQTATSENTAACGKYIEKLEKEGYEAYWPIRDTNQNDSIGINICDANLRKIHEADEIHIYYLKESAGINFDIGAVYMLVRILGLKKKIVFVNKNEFADDIGGHKGKSFVRILDFLDRNT